MASKLPDLAMSHPAWPCQVINMFPISVRPTLTLSPSSQPTQCEGKGDKDLWDNHFQLMNSKYM